MAASVKLVSRPQTPSFRNESVQTLFFDKAAGRAGKIWSGDETSVKQANIHMHVHNAVPLVWGAASSGSPQLRKKVAIK